MMQTWLKYSSSWNVNAEGFVGFFLRQALRRTQGTDSRKRKQTGKKEKPLMKKQVE
jgi:hypothetical protein